MSVPRDPVKNPREGDVLRLPDRRVLSANRHFVVYHDGQWSIRIPIRQWRREMANAMVVKYGETNHGGAK